MPRETLFPRKPGLGSYAGGTNIDTRFPGKAMPAFDQVALNTTDRLHHPIAYLETLAPANSHPRGYYGINTTMLRLDNGTETVDTTFGDVAQSMVICDSQTAAKGTGGGGGSFTAGTRVMICGFGSSTTPRCAIRDLTTDTTPWGTQTGSTFAQFWAIVRVGNGDLYAQTDTGVASLVEWRISKCPFGNDPTLAASWGNGFEVGGPEWAITGLCALGDSVVVGKPDGIYVYDDLTKRFVQILQLKPHAANGLRMAAVTNGVMVPTHDGHLYFTDGVSVQDVTPYKREQRPRDTYTGRITSIVDGADAIYAVQDCFYNTTQQFGLKVISYIGGVAVDETAAVTNGNLTNGMTLTNYGAAAGDRIYIGADVPIEALVFRITTNENAAAAALSGRYSNATIGTVLPFTTSFTAFTGIRDGTILKDAGKSLKITGFPASASVAAISASDINTYDLMKSTSLDFGAIGVLVKYWWALTISGTVTAATRVDEVEMVPGRPGLPLDDSTGPFTAANDFTNRNDAGGLTKVLVFDRERTVGGTWHEIYAADMGGIVSALGWTSGRIGQAGGAQNMGNSLVLVGRHKRVAIHESPTRDPSRTTEPILVQYTTTEPGPVLPLTPGDGTYLDDGDRENRQKKKMLTDLYVEGNHIQAGANPDIVCIYVQIDENQERHEVGRVSGAPAKIIPHKSFSGRKFKFWAAFSDAQQTQEKAPEITYIDVGFEYETHGGEVIPFPAQATVPTT